MKILVCDDEAPARDRLVSMIGELEGFEAVGQAANGMEALQQTQQLQPDIVLLDIRMPGMDGIEAARHLSGAENPPAVIFTTAYDSYALQAFEASAIDYLLKPVRLERLQEALDKAGKLTRAHINSLDEHHEPDARTHICVRFRGDLQLIPVQDICYFMADQKYVTVRHVNGEVLIEEALKSLEQEFGQQFIRIHRNALVARAFLVGLQKTADGRHVVKLKNCDKQLEVSRRHLSEVRQLLKSG